MARLEAQLARTQAAVKRQAAAVRALPERHHVMSLVMIFAYH